MPFTASKAGFSPGLVVVAMLAIAAVAAVAPAADVTESVTLFQRGAYEDCIRLCAQAIEDGEYSELWRLNKIRAELACGRYQEARATLDSALQRFSSSVRLRWLGATVCRFNGDQERAGKLLDEIDQLVSRAAWQYSDPASRVTLGRYYLSQGIDPKEVLQATISAVKKQQPDYADAYLAAGQLALEKHDYALAAEELGKAVKADANDPDILQGLARAFQPSDDEKSSNFVARALERNPRHVDSLLMLIDSHIDAERYSLAQELIADVLAVNPLEPRAWAYRAVLAHLVSDERDEYLSRQMALGWWSANPDVDYLIGRKLSQKYRFREGAEHQRQALAMDARYLPAKIQLSEDLLRLGQEREGWTLAQEVSAADGYNVVAHNLTTLRDHLSKFATLTGDGFVVHMDAREAEIYGDRVLSLLGRARSTLLAKYDVELAQPTLVEIFPEQQDFAIRTFGLPGGDGFLGVCFGNVITANSPASRGESPVSWESVLWHEFCHVVTLNKTQNRMPRWLSEGISVYEERQADPTWGESMNPTYRRFILEGELTPVSELSGAFLHAPSPIHLQFAYYESSLVVEYLVEKHGAETLRQILTDLGVGMPINDSLQRYTGSLVELDREFAEFAEKRAKEFAPAADWSEPQLPEGAGVAELTSFLKEHPKNYAGLQARAQLLIQAEAWDDALDVLNRMLELYPSDEAVFAHLVSVHRKRGDTDQELSALERWSAVSCDAVPAYLRLIELHLAAENWSGVQQASERLLACNPLIASPHRALAAAAEAQGQDGVAIAALRTTLKMSPLDEVDLHYRLACLLQKQGDLPAAKRSLLQALEEAPRFLEAHHKLLEIIRQIDQNKGDPPDNP